MKKLKVAILAAVVLIGIAGLKIAVDIKKETVLNPLVKLPDKKRVEKKDYKVVGFLPTWMIGKTIDYCDELSHLIFLGIEVNENGDLVWDGQSKKIYNSEYVDQKKRADKCGIKNIVGIKQFDDNKLNQLMASESAILNLIEQVKELVLKESFDGVNIDFEYQGSPTKILNEDVVNLAEKMKAAGVGEVSIDVFANTIIKGDPDRLKKIIESTDDLVVMAYDFHRPGSDFAGPVAPVDAPVGERNIIEITEKIVSLQLNRKKIVLAYPLYGYEWKTDGDEFGSKVKKGFWALASYKRMKDVVNNKDSMENFKLTWDEKSMSPWVAYTENGENKQIYYENVESLRRKVKLIADIQLGGVGFWALGYEGNDNEVWNEVGRLLQQENKY